MRQDDCLKCACCGFDFFTTYGKIGRGFIEAHHTKPVSTLHEDGEETHLDDIALVCSNCHRMLHRRRPWLGMEDLSELLVANKTNEHKKNIK
ncbi:HNH endonuclease [Candidatus Spongiihabitans sp.]|uniref:HNH endonuclease n=1 Tax=Candidatus Spongiihabitans sp. TaxID=3101308 RepID=UPI003C6F83A0